jgi:hypothetical protein
VAVHIPLTSGFVVPDCGSPDDRHDPPGTRPAAYDYVYHDQYRAYDPWSGFDHVMVLCPECCARTRWLAEHPELNPGFFAPPPVRIRVIRDANTLEPVI